MNRIISRNKQTKTTHKNTNHMVCIHYRYFRIHQSRCQEAKIHTEIDNIHKYEQRWLKDTFSTKSTIKNYQIFVKIKKDKI